MVKDEAAKVHAKISNYDFFMTMGNLAEYVNLVHTIFNNASVKVEFQKWASKDWKPRPFALPPTFT